MQIIISQNVFIMLDNKTIRNPAAAASTTTHNFTLKWRWSSCLRQTLMLHCTCQAKILKVLSNEKKNHHKYWIKTWSKTCKFNHVKAYERNNKPFNDVYGVHLLCPCIKYKATIVFARFLFCLCFCFCVCELTHSYTYSVGVLICNVNCVLKNCFLFIRFMRANFPSIFVIQIRIRNWIFEHSSWLKTKKSSNNYLNLLSHSWTRTWTEKLNE